MKASFGGVFRPTVSGKFIYVGENKLHIKGVTYGTFRLNRGGEPYPEPEIVEKDFARMTASGLNMARTYTVPPRWLLDLAHEHGLHILVGLPWEQHVCFLDGRQRVLDIRRRLRTEVSTCAGHPALLAYAIGNEIPASIVRWYGARRVEQFLKALYQDVKKEDPEALVTYVNYPTTEYLKLPFLDFVAFNVYLESRERLDAYLARLQNNADDRPLVLAEVGLDSRRNGKLAQAQALDWQLRSVFEAGCAGAFVFAWTDEWHRNGNNIDDWDFGLTCRDRQPKPALEAVRKAFADAPFPVDLPWLRVSVVVCTYNGSRTIRGCLEGLLKLDYSDFEVIVVDDGSTDATAVVVGEFAHRDNFRVISTENLGLSSARNTGMRAATGEIIAYLDDDAFPDPHWLTYLASTFMTTSHAGVGGPNIAPPGDGLVADCVANAPGNPHHLLISDREAEHIPGCNMAVRKTCLEAIGGFDPLFRVAGDDVDVCWRLRQQGWTLGFSPAAMVWHHRRNSVRAYWKQQQGYGKAEALLEKKWPEKYSSMGHLTWSGQLYGRGAIQSLDWQREQIHYGMWGTGLFQSLYQPTPSMLSLLPQMPEWYLLICILAGLSTLGLFWPPLVLALPLLFLSIGASLAQASLGAIRASFIPAPKSWLTGLKLRSLTAFLHLLQPLARLYGRLNNGLTPWRRGARGYAPPWPRTSTVWSEHGQDVDTWLQAIETTLKVAGNGVYRASRSDRWDLAVRGGLGGSARLRMAIEEHGGGRQLVHFRTWPRCSATGLGLTFLCAVLAAGAAQSQAWLSCAVFGAVSIVFVIRLFQDSAAATAAVLKALPTFDEKEGDSTRKLSTEPLPTHPDKNGMAHQMGTKYENQMDGPPQLDRSEMRSPKRETD